MLPRGSWDFEILFQSANTEYSDDLKLGISCPFSVLMSLLAVSPAWENVPLPSLPTLQPEKVHFNATLLPPLIRAVPSGNGLVAGRLLETLLLVILTRPSSWSAGAFNPPGSLQGRKQNFPAFNPPRTLKA
ncbi:unnamed protein product [Enterobius vermicularis]|uniref:Uncharacterized protein n=1 Tax=Enterobius vermicularis TaxID=51028 RepID=A0A0N4VAP1_ENTVE|nr:unnamed protein product [Enterobius vermicularis]